MIPSPAHILKVIIDWFGEDMKTRISAPVLVDMIPMIEADIYVISIQ